MTISKISKAPVKPPNPNQFLGAHTSSWSQSDVSKLIVYNEYIYYMHNYNTEYDVYTERVIKNARFSHNGRWINKQNIEYSYITPLPQQIETAAKLWHKNRFDMDLYEYLITMGF